MKVRTGKNAVLVNKHGAKLRKRHNNSRADRDMSLGVPFIADKDEADD